MVNVDWFFISHRLPIAIEAKKKGWEVLVLAGDTGRGNILNKYGIKFVPWKISRSGTNILDEFSAFFHLVKIVKSFNPHIVHNVGIKSVIYGSITSILLKKPYINAIAGLGFVFGSTLNAKIIKQFVTPFFRIIFNSKKSKLILQNRDDIKLFTENGYCPLSKIRLIRGSGVNLNEFKFVPEIVSEYSLVCLPSRMLWDKGIGEFVQAIRILKTRNPDLKVKFILAGGIDKENPAKIPKEQILEWVKEGLLEWWGHRENMVELLSTVNMVVLPSYNEGLPKVLIEAAAIGRVIITTDVPGCRELIIDDINGIIIPPKNAASLANAIQLLLKDKEKCKLFIKNGLEIVRKDFPIEYVVESTFNVYNSVLVST